MTDTIPVPPSDETSGSITEVVAQFDDLIEGEMKLAKVGERRIALIRTASGVHALDNACPHQGYGMVTGALDGELITCQWHNWKFRVDTGECVLGEENLPCHQVSIDKGEVSVTVTEPTPEQARAKLWPSLRRGIEDHYVGQVSRDTVRLLSNGATPAEIAWVGIDHNVRRDEWGPGHGMATGADCLAWAEERSGDDRALPLVQGLAALAEPARGRPARDLVEPSDADFVASVEAEDYEAAMGAARRLADGSPAAARREFIEAASMHHLSYGHGIIYVQKAFELLERVGWDKAAVVLPEVARSTTGATREDALPYMRKAVAAVAAADLESLATVPLDPSWSDPTLVDVFLDSGHPPIDEAIAALASGAGVERILDAVVDAVSRRLLRYDLDVEFDTEEAFGWLDITHGLTTARAARWAYRAHPSAATVRQALWSVWLCHDTGRAEREHGARPEPVIDPTTGDVAMLIRRGEEEAAVNAIAAAGADAGDAMIDAALADGAGSFIVTAHLIKMTRASIEEFDHSGSLLPLLATGRYLAAPRMERFVSRNVAASLDFVHTGRPPKR
ncbi:MAG: Rieske 2Fe-2S domain-containing protein [Actinomycetota bacterium]